MGGLRVEVKENDEAPYGTAVSRQTDAPQSGVVRLKSAVAGRGSRAKNVFSMRIRGSRHVGLLGSRFVGG
jgi:hypothetical protein